MKRLGTYRNETCIEPLDPYRNIWYEYEYRYTPNIFMCQYTVYKGVVRFFYNLVTNEPIASHETRNALQSASTRSWSPAGRPLMILLKDESPFFRGSEMPL